MTTTKSSSFVTAIAGRCTTCTTRTIRAELTTGHIVELDITDLTPAQELRAHTAGQPTYRVVWRHHQIQIRPRTPRDIRTHPAGYTTGGRIWTNHTCTTERTRP